MNSESASHPVTSCRALVACRGAPLPPIGPWPVTKNAMSRWNVDHYPYDIIYTQKCTFIMFIYKYIIYIYPVYNSIYIYITQFNSRSVGVQAFQAVQSCFHQQYFVHRRSVLLKKIPQSKNTAQEWRNILVSTLRTFNSRLTAP